ncbi:phage RecT family recombinase [Paraburkholderia youngii]|uniref:recombinase RecT n=1 Tax=Paraburkholderia youngii TaxID=2782701 RepID=UPI003D24219D
MSVADLKRIATSERKPNPVASFSAYLDRYKPQLALTLPKHLKLERVVRLAVIAYKASPKIRACTPQSIVEAITTSAVLGLEIGVDGQGFLVPYGDVCQFVPGWKGLVDLVSRAGRASVWTGAVFEGDDFEYAYGDNPFIRHIPGGEDDPQKIIFVYAVGRVKGSDYPIIDVWPIRKVWKPPRPLQQAGREALFISRARTVRAQVPAVAGAEVRSEVDRTV